MATKKSQVLADDIAAALPRRGVTQAVTRGEDTDGNPTILVGTGVAGTAGAFIRVKAISWTAQDALGLAGEVYTPHVIQIVTEADAAVTLTFRTRVMAELMNRGTMLEVYECPDGDAPAVGELTAGQLLVTLSPQPEHGIRMSQ